MKVTRLRETARVTKPYTDEQWQQIDRLGRVVDRAIAGAGLRLTMGGEPTFVSIDDMDGAEWNTAALGADQAAPCRRAAAPPAAVAGRRAALLHYGQGKWYPGEPLPRWALGCFWRKDGEPVWRDPALFAGDGGGRGIGLDEARRFAAGLAERLQIDPSYVIAGYEDAWYYLEREQRLPVNVDPHKADLRDPAGAGPARRPARPRARPGDRLRPAAAAHARPRRRSLDERALAVPARPHDPAPRRLADGPPPAARFPAARSPRPTCRSIYDVDPFAPRDALPSRHGFSAYIVVRAPSCCNRRTIRARRSRASGRARRTGAAAADRGAHRDLLRAARRQALHLPAADRRSSRTTSSSSPPSRTPPSSSS